MHAMAPATLTAIVGLTVTITTPYYPFPRLYNFSDTVGVLTTPIVLIAGLIALATVWATRRLRSPNTGSQVALDRTFVYAASVVAIVGIWIATWGLMFDAFQLSSFYGSVAAAPAMTLFFVTVALLMTSLDEEASDARRWSAVASIAALLLLMTTSKGRTISLSQLNEGVRSSIGRHMPADWSRHTPFMTLDDNTVYLDMDNPSTSALMQYSVIKILLLSRSPVFSPDKLVVRSFSRYGR
jgi:cation transport ATPase